MRISGGRKEREEKRRRGGRAIVLCLFNLLLHDRV
jgi:hypothetical protein